MSICAGSKSLALLLAVALALTEIVSWGRAEANVFCLQRCSPSDFPNECVENTDCSGMATSCPLYYKEEFLTAELCSAFQLSSPIIEESNINYLGGHGGYTYCSYNCNGTSWNSSFPGLCLNQCPLEIGGCPVNGYKEFPSNAQCRDFQDQVSTSSFFCIYAETFSSFPNYCTEEGQLCPTSRTISGNPAYLIAEPLEFGNQSDCLTFQDSRMTIESCGDCIEEMAKFVSSSYLECIEDIGAIIEESCASSDLVGLEGLCNYVANEDKLFEMCADAHYDFKKFENKIASICGSDSSVSCAASIDYSTRLEERLNWAESEVEKKASYGIGVAAMVVSVFGFVMAAILAIKEWRRR